MSKDKLDELAKNLVFPAIKIGLEGLKNDDDFNYTEDEIALAQDIIGILLGDEETTERLSKYL